jgi:glycerate kinase
MRRARALACPASLKGVLSAREAAAALAEGLREWSDADELPVADGGEGSLDALHAALEGEWRTYEVHDAFGRPRQAKALWHGANVSIEAAEAIPLDPARLDPVAASSRGLGELVAALGRPRELLVCLGGTANVDGGAGLLEVVHELPATTRVACDVDVPLRDAVDVFAAQKGATPAQLPELAARLAPLAAYAELPGSGAAGGLGAAFASLGAELCPGAPMILDLLRFEPAR